jgi:hypothetical protein
MAVGRKQQGLRSPSARPWIEPINSEQQLVKAKLGLGTLPAGAAIGDDTAALLLISKPGIPYRFRYRITANSAKHWTRPRPITYLVPRVIDFAVDL